MGGRAYISSLSDGVVSRRSLSHQIEVLTDKARMRAVIAAVENAKAKAFTKTELEEVLGGPRAGLV